MTRADLDDRAALPHAARVASAAALRGRDLLRRALGRLGFELR